MHLMMLSSNRSSGGGGGGGGVTCSRNKILWLVIATTGLWLLFQFEGGGAGGGVTSNLQSTATSMVSIVTKQQQQQQQSDDDNDKRPYFILHVGLQKTGTTFLQDTLCSDVAKEKLLQDNYVWLGICDNDRSSTETATTTTTPIKGNSPLFFSVNNTYAHLPKLPVANLLHQILKAKASGQGMILSDENISLLHPNTVAALAAVLNPIFRVRVVIVYRRLYEWIPSWHNMYYKVNHEKAWKGQQDITWNFPKNGQGSGLSFDLENRFGTSDIIADVELLQQHPAQMVYNKFIQFFHDVMIMNLHNLPGATVPIVPSSSSSNHHGHGTGAAAALKIDPTLHHFICSIVPHAKQTCHAVEHEIVHGATFNNPSTSFDYDLLAMAAYRHGYFSSSSSNIVQNNNNNNNNNANNPQQGPLSRIQAGIEIQKYNDQLKQEQQNNNNNKTLESFPRISLLEEKLHRLLQLSLMGERNLFPTTTNEQDEMEHRRNFEVFKSKLCSLDTQAVLNDPTWQSFLKSLLVDI